MGIVDEKLEKKYFHFVNAKFYLTSTFENVLMVYNDMFLLFVCTF